MNLLCNLYSADLTVLSRYILHQFGYYAEYCHFLMLEASPKRLYLRHTCKRPSSDLGRVTHRLGMPGLLSAFSNSSSTPGFFFSFLTRESTARSAHFSSSSPCFQPSNRLTAGLVNENRLDITNAKINKQNLHATSFSEALKSKCIVIKAAV